MFPSGGSLRLVSHWFVCIAADKMGRALEKVFKLSKSSFSPLGAKQLNSHSKQLHLPTHQPWSQRHQTAGKHVYVEVLGLLSLVCPLSVCWCPGRTTEIRQQTTRQQLIHSLQSQSVWMDAWSDDDSAHLALSESPRPPRTLVWPQKWGNIVMKRAYSHQLCPILAAISHISRHIKSLYGLVGEVLTGPLVNKKKR